MIQRILITMALFMLLGIPAAYGQQSPEQVHEKVAKAMGAEENVQAKTDEWSYEKQNIVQDIRDAKYRVTWLQYRQEKYGQYIAKTQEDIKLLDIQKANLHKLREQLAPYLETIVLRLQDFIAQDLPFLQDERQKRIDILVSSLNNPDLALSERMRRVFEEGLQIEVQYGQMTIAEDQVLTIDGVETQVVVLRLGRLGMYYMTMDEEQTGYYNRATGQWESLPKSMNRNISLAVDIANGTRTAEIVNLPLPSGAVE